MDILHTLEDIDSRLDKARGNLGRWFAFVASVAIGAVGVSWGIRSYLAGRSASRWRSLDTHLTVAGGLLNRPIVLVKTDADVAATEIRASTKEAWGEMARSFQAARQDDLDRAIESSSSLRASSGKDRSTAMVFALCGSREKMGLDDFADRLEIRRTWMNGHPALRANVVKEGVAGFRLTAGDRELAFGFDPKLPASFPDEFRGLVEGGAFVNSKLTWNPSDRSFELSLAADKLEAEGKLDALLGKVGPDDSSFSLFKGALTIKLLPSKEAGGPPKRMLSVLGADALGREFEWIPIGALTQGSEILPASVGASPEKTEHSVTGAK